MPGARILVLSVAYKNHSDDLRESPSLRSMAILQERGVQVNYHDPYLLRLPKMRRFDSQLESVGVNAETPGQYDAVVIATDRSSYDYAFILRRARLVVNARNGTHGVMEQREKVVRC